MKKNIFLFVFPIMFCFTYAFSAGIYENANQSAEFIRTLTRYASTDIDSAFYNPAGTVFMQDGFYAYLSDQMIFDYQEMNDSSPALSGYGYPSKYKGKAMTWAFPDIYAVYKQDNWSAFFNAGLIGRGAAATYNEGLPMFNKAVIDYATYVGINYAGCTYLTSIDTDGKLEAYAFFIGMTFGSAYKVNEIFSIGGGIRYVHAEQNTKLKYTFNSAIMDGVTDITSFLNNIDIDVDAKGDSCGFIGSIDVKPVKDMNIGFRYEYYTTMKVKNDMPEKFEGPANLISAFEEGETTKMTLPMNAAIGISYMVIPELKAEAGFVYYLNKYADWGKDDDGDEIAEKYNNGYDISISFEYAFIQQLKGSIGYSYSVSGVNSKTRTNEQFGLTSNAFALGGTYSFANGIDFTLASMIAFFKDTKETNASPDTGSTTYKERVYNIAASVSYKFM